ncbi:lytic transglycosylase domain-containing protein [Bradyrhizobium iriomotense]|uniref:lytic transglycosylase domain-containing protein n=1 Tax=Bradyrhizobium iriomotense TaxID=441950 RepID=UPI0032AE955D
MVGTAYLAELLDRYGAPGAFAAYNAGPARYERHITGEPLPAEMQAYVANLATLVGVSTRWPALLDRRPALRHAIGTQEQSRLATGQERCKRRDRFFGCSRLVIDHSEGASLFSARSDVGGAR